MGMPTPVGTSLRRRALEPMLQKLARYIPQRLFLDPALFDVYEQRGWPRTPVAFHQPIPDTRALSPELWSTPSELTGLDLNEAGQLNLVRELSARFRSEYERLDARDEDGFRFHFDQRSFGPVDAEMLFSMVRWSKP